MRLGSCGLSERRLLVSGTSPKCIDLEGLVPVQKMSHRD